VPEPKNPLQCFAKLGLIGCIGLAACVAAKWDKPGTTQADHDRDIRECQDAAQRGAIFGLGVGVTIQNSFNRCMTDRGYQLRQ
jgi:hypothetical protein